MISPYDYEELKIRRKIKFLLWFFIVSLAMSGITAFPLESELSWVRSALLRSSFAGSDVTSWIVKVHQAVRDNNLQYPFMAYGTDWLAFAHLVIAVVFIGPLKDPVKNIWVIQFGIIACVGVIPLAFIAGAIREIPFFWRLIDCSFGVFGIIPLLLCLKYIRTLEKNHTSFLLEIPAGRNRRLDLDEAKIFDF